MPTDVYTDHGALLRIQYTRESLPEFLSTLYPPDPRATDDDFAHVEDGPGGTMRFWPLTDRANTWMSAFYLTSGGAQGLAKVAMRNAACRTLLACRAFEVEPPDGLVHIAEGKFPEVEKRASADTRLLPRGLPCGNRRETGESIKVLEERWDELAPNEKRKTAQMLEELRGLQGVQIPAKIGAYVGDKVSPAVRGAAIFIRTQHFPPGVAAGVREAYLQELMGVSDVDEAAEKVASLDQELGLSRYWGKIPDPYVSVIAHTKTAEWSWSHGNEFVTERELISSFQERSQYKNLSRVFGHDVAEKLVRDPVGEFKKLSQAGKILAARIAGYNKGEAFVR